MNDINQLLKEVTKWGNLEENILGIALVGSYARGTANKNSDIDLMIIVKNQEVFISDNNWIKQFGKVKEIKNETWSQLKTKRVFYENGLELEFNFDKISWADPEDVGTKSIVTDDIRILVDKEKILKDLTSKL